MARSKGNHIGGKIPLKSKYTFADADEIANRDKTAYQNPASAFVQIPPGDRGGNLNEPGLGVRSGNAKFGPVPR